MAALGLSVAPLDDCIPLQVRFWAATASATSRTWADGRAQADPQLWAAPTRALPTHGRHRAHRGAPLHPATCTTTRAPASLTARAGIGRARTAADDRLGRGPSASPRKRPHVHHGR